MTFSENQPTDVVKRSEALEFAIATDLSVYEIQRDRLVEEDHIQYAREVVMRLPNRLPLDSMIPIIKADIVKLRLDNNLVAQYLNYFLAERLGDQQFDRYMNLEDRV